MSATEQRKISLSVRALAEFCAEGGDLTPSGSVRRMLEGAQAHRGVQKTYGPGWKAEVPLARDIDLGGLTVALQGRADGVCLRGGDSIVEEIKSTADDPSGLTGGEYPAHWLQALFYAAILAWREGLGHAQPQHGFGLPLHAPVAVRAAGLHPDELNAARREALGIGGLQILVQEGGGGQAAVLVLI